jgi:hypothetical protein
MAFRKKATVILLHKPDILIVPECEHPDKLLLEKDTLTPSDVLWYGTNKNKGIGVFSFGNYRLHLLDIHNPDLKIILPIAVTGGACDFTLFAIWAYNPQDPSYRYIGQVWKAVLYYENLLKNGRVLLAGDFNSNVMWDKLKRKVSHSMLVEKLADLKIFSTYHQHLNLAQGIEEHPTYFMYRHQNKPYHIDYCFASEEFIYKLETVEIGTHEEWANYSDHAPLIVSFKE